MDWFSIKQTNRLPIIPEFLGKNIMLHVTPKCPSSMYIGMPIQKAFKFSLDSGKIKGICQTFNKTNIFQKIGISPQKASASKQSLNSSFSNNFWGQKNANRDLVLESEYSENDDFTERCVKFYKQIAAKVLKFRGEMKSKFKLEFGLGSDLEAMLFLLQKWELSHALQKKVKTMDEEKNFLMNESKTMQKERKNLNKKNKDLVLENNRLKRQNELLLEEKNYFINHKNCFDNLLNVNEQLSMMNKSSSINIGKTKANISAIDLLTDRNRVGLLRNVLKKDSFGNP